MAQITISKSIHASPERTFEFLTDFAGAPARIRAIKRIEILTPGPIRAGTRFRETRIMFKREATEEMEVLAFDPPRSVVLGCESCGSRFRTEFTVAADGAESTVTMTFMAQPISFFARLMSPLMKPMLKSCAKSCEEDLEDIKRALEGTAP